MVQHGTYRFTRVLIKDCVNALGGGGEALRVGKPLLFSSKQNLEGQVLFVRTVRRLLVLQL